MYYLHSAPRKFKLRSAGWAYFAYYDAFWSLRRCHPSLFKQRSNIRQSSAASLKEQEVKDIKIVATVASSVAAILLTAGWSVLHMCNSQQRREMSHSSATSAVSYQKLKQCLRVRVLLIKTSSGCGLMKSAICCFLPVACFFRRVRDDKCEARNILINRLS